MNVKEAIANAKSHAGEMFSGETISDLGVEEVDRDEEVWRITLGLSRPWDKPPRSIIPPSAAEDRPHHRSYYVFTISDEDGRMINVRLRNG